MGGKLHVTKMTKTTILLLEMFCPLRTYRVKGIISGAFIRVLKCTLYGECFMPLMAMKQIYWKYNRQQITKGDAVIKHRGKKKEK